MFKQEKSYYEHQTRQKTNVVKPQTARCEIQRDKTSTTIRGKYSIQESPMVHLLRQEEVRIII